MAVVFVERLAGGTARDHFDVAVDVGRTAEFADEELEEGGVGEAVSFALDKADDEKEDNKGKKIKADKPWGTK